jgi:signal transduction histidine kinase
MITKQRRAWLLRAGQVAAMLAMALLGAIDLVDRLGGGRLPIVAAAVAVALGTAAVWWWGQRWGPRRLPVLALLLSVGSLLVTAAKLSANGSAAGGSWGLAETVGMLLVLLVVARRGAAPLAALAIAVGGLAITAQPLRSGVGSVGIILGLLQALAAAGAVALGAYLRFVANTREREIAAVRAEQRAEFARDLHDFIAHHVAGIVVQAQGARFVAEQDPRRVITALEQIEHAGGETMSAMRRMVGVLRGQGTDAPVAPLAGMADLEPLIKGFSASGGPSAWLHVDGVLDGLPVDVTTSAYRVVMEALTNVRQHASRATTVDVWVRRAPDWLLVRVVNDGPAPQRGTLPRERAGYGLLGLTERVGAIGGRLKAGPGIQGGWILDAAFPVKREMAR